MPIMAGRVQNGSYHDEVVGVKEGVDDEGRKACGKATTEGGKRMWEAGEKRRGGKRGEAPSD